MVIKDRGELVKRDRQRATSRKKKSKGKRVVCKGNSTLDIYQLEQNEPKKALMRKWSD